MLFSSTASALPSDRKQPVRISAQYAEIKEKEGYSYYKGNVRLRQGSLLVEAEKLELFHPNKQLKKVVASGTKKQPVYFEHQPKKGDEIAKGIAKTLTRQLKPDQLILKGDARVCQKGNEQRGETITYEIQKHIMEAKKRTLTIFTPKGVTRDCSEIEKYASASRKKK